MRSLRLLAPLLLLPAAAAAQAAAPVRVPYVLDSLPNGLTWIVHEDHSAPVAAVNVWYHVGSGDEKPGRTGFAHLFEHLMFMGSQHAPYPAFDRLLEGAGANNNGSTTDPQDAFGYGRHEGEYGMLVLSRFPIENEFIRTFQTFLWRDMPGALLPVDPSTGEPYYSDAEVALLRLSSKSFWDVPIKVPAAGGGLPWRLHLLCSHPTPPVFDGPEDRNGRRNHYTIKSDLPLPDPLASEQKIGDLLAILTGQRPAATNGQLGADAGRG